MKLNNNGWGMKEMVIFMSVLLAFLLLAVYNVNKLYKAMEHTKTDVTYVKNSNNETEEVIKTPVKTNPVDEKYYINLEKRFKSATEDYINKYKYDLSSDILKVSYDTLNELGFITMRDQFNQNTCDGYSNVFYDNENEEYVIKSYIRCSNYTSVGY